MKSGSFQTNAHRVKVSTLAVEWIEIGYILADIAAATVSTLAVEWIEIFGRKGGAYYKGVSTLAVEWIEIGR